MKDKQVIDSKFNIKNLSFNQQNIDKLYTILPEVFEDGKINREKLLDALNLTIDYDYEPNWTTETYGLNWDGKYSTHRDLILETRQTLVPEIAKSVDFENSKNVFIEGENFEVLKILQNSYFGKVDFIYIDPPYNTGNDFVYDDKTRISTTKRNEEKKITGQHAIGKKDRFHFHTKWLSLMYRRLKLAKRLLSEKGVIFISIDDNEYARLKIICDEIFGEVNFVASFFWNSKNYPSGNTVGDPKIDIVGEYILCYQADISQNIFNINPNTKEELVRKGYVNKDEYFNERGYYALTTLWRSNSGNSF